MSVTRVPKGFEITHHTRPSECCCLPCSSHSSKINAVVAPGSNMSGSCSPLEVISPKGLRPLDSVRQYSTKPELPRNIYVEILSVIDRWATWKPRYYKNILDEIIAKISPALNARPRRDSDQRLVVGYQGRRNLTTPAPAMTAITGWSPGRSNLIKQHSSKYTSDEAPATSHHIV